MSAKKQIQKEIMEAYVFLREKNMSIPSETIEFMKDASIEKLNQVKNNVDLDFVSKQRELLIAFLESISTSKKDTNLIVIDAFLKEHNSN